ncbi:hypothetical protein [Alicyclobacillus acidiphilus]|uniref:hypothetical protein n=1 Tax=Alicyclobacillus acidiphilus TaxID=182455 RepID=UPI000830F7F7|nr:hypothetical protein [Alicyclobacillus acidiphilus]
MGKSSGYDTESIYFDDEVLFHETVMEYITRESEEKLRSKEYGSDLPGVMTEDTFRLLMETGEPIS